MSYPYRMLTRGGRPQPAFLCYVLFGRCGCGSRGSVFPAWTRWAEEPSQFLSSEVARERNTTSTSAVTLSLTRTLAGLPPSDSGRKVLSSQQGELKEGRKPSFPGRTGAPRKVVLLALVPTLLRGERMGSAMPCPDPSGLGEVIGSKV